MSKQILSTKKAPAAVGPYSQGTVANGFLFTSGAIPLDPETGEVVGKTAAEQAAQCMKNLEAVLAAGRCSFGDVVKTTLYLVNLADFQLVNGEYAKYFSGNPPARSTVEVKGLVKGVLVEIDMIAHVPDKAFTPKPSTV